ncbi:MAG: AraC family transcriptional regulator [Verrucomicrobia bacterium]|nr:AraC family transcriptional regulator [Verrucomicrobiota bacterium]
MHNSGKKAHSIDSSRSAPLHVYSWFSRQHGMEDAFHLRVHRARGVLAFPPHIHRGFCEFTFGLRGYIVHTLNGREHRCGPRDILFVRENDRHELAGRNVVILNLEFHCRWLKAAEDFWNVPGLLTPLQESEQPPAVRVPPRPWAAIRRELDWLARHPAGLEAHLRFGRFLMGLLHDRFLPGLLQIPAGLPDWLREALRWLESPWRPDLDVADFVRQCGRTPEHVARACRRYLGLTPSQHLNRLRLKRAADLLVFTDCGLVEIAHETGFPNLSYFHRLFRQAFGTTPHAYRHARLGSSD